MSEIEAPGATPLPPDYPPILYVPCVQHVKDPDDLEVEYRATRDGRTALLVYSALDRLHKCCGAGQPWFLMPTLKLDDLYQVHPFDTVLLDVVLPDELKKPGAIADGPGVAEVSPAPGRTPAPGPQSNGEASPVPIPAQSPAAPSQSAETDAAPAQTRRGSLASRLGGR